MQDKIVRKEKFLEELLILRALVRQALGKYRLEDFDFHVLKKGDFYAVVSSCNRGRCRECDERISVGEGLILKLRGFVFISTTKHKHERTENYTFHRYHF